MHHVRCKSKEHVQHAELYTFASSHRSLPSDFNICCFRFHKLLKEEPFVHVHISNLAAQTGVTRFTQLNDYWIYNKTENLDTEQLHEFTHLLIEAKSKYSSNLKAYQHTHVILDSIESFSQVAVNYKLIPPVKIKTKPALFILERKDFREYPHGHSISFDSVETDSGSRQMSVEVSDGSYLGEDVYEPYKTELTTEEDNVSQIEVEVINTEESILTPSLTIIHEDLEAQQPEEKPENDKLGKIKKSFDELKLLRKERKMKAIEKIKSETRKEVVASAKEKLKEIMKRHKHIAEELSEAVIDDVKSQIEEKDGRGDIPETELNVELESSNIQEIVPNAEQVVEITDTSESINRTNENIDAIVEEVIVRLIDRKIYDDKTKPEDIKAEDRQVIQKIVEEILAEKMNYTTQNTKS